MSKWTRERPTLLGWYWYCTKPGARPEMVHLVLEDWGRKRLIARGADYAWREVRRMKGLWHGPLVPPNTEGAE